MPRGCRLAGRPNAETRCAEQGRGEPVLCTAPCQDGLFGLQGCLNRDLFWVLNVELYSLIASPGVETLSKKCGFPTLPGYIHVVTVHKSHIQ